MLNHSDIRDRMAELRTISIKYGKVEAAILDYLDYLMRAVEDLEVQVREDSALLNQVEQLCTAEKSFSYWASVAFGVKPRDVLRKILHEAQRQAAESSGRTHQRPSEGESSPTQGEGSYAGGERHIHDDRTSPVPAPRDEG